MHVVRSIEYGFVLPAEPPGPEVTDDGKCRLLRVAGIDRQLQFCRVCLAPGAMAPPRSGPEVVVILGHHPASSDEETLSTSVVLGAHFAGLDVVVVREDRIGWARVTCAPNVRAELAATAVAASKVIGGWDESDSIAVELDAHAFEVVMEWNDTHWSAHVTPRAR